MSDEVKVVEKPKEKETPTNEKPITKNDVLRELSKEYGVNLFDVDGLKEFSNYVESKKTDLDKANEQLQALQTEKTTWETKFKEYEAKLKASELGIAQENLMDALKLADGNPDNLAKVLEKYPTLSNRVDVGFGVQGKTTPPPKGMSEAEKYMEENYKNNPYYQPKTK